MGVKRKTYRFRKNEVIEVEEFHDGLYGAPGKRRKEKRTPTTEQMRRANALEKARRCRRKLLEYFQSGDVFATWTYRVDERPGDMQGALTDFRRAIRIVRREYKKRNRELFWIRNIERGTKGAWHIHLVINQIGDTEAILQQAWQKGGTYVCDIRKSRYYSEDFSDLANYITKDEHTVEKKKDGNSGKPRLSESSYSTSRNMPLPPPKVDTLVHWKKEARPKKGYRIIGLFEGVNPVTGFLYRRYTMVREVLRE